MPGPPVARMMSASFMRRFVLGSDGASIQPMMPSGAPALTAASSTSFAAAIVQPLARGCGLMMTPLRVLRVTPFLAITSLMVTSDCTSVATGRPSAGSVMSCEATNVIVPVSIA